MRVRRFLTAIVAMASAIVVGQLAAQKPSAAIGEPVVNGAWFEVASQSDNSNLNAYSAVYPPSGASNTTTYGGLCTDKAKGFSSFQVSQVLLKWDTSALPDDAHVLNASLFVNAFGYSAQSEDARSVTADWVGDWGTADIGDWAPDPPTDALAGYPLELLNQQRQQGYWLLELPLSSVDRVRRDGITGLRLHISGGQPQGYNGFCFNSVMGGAKAMLWVQYTSTAAPILPSPGECQWIDVNGTPAFGCAPADAPSLSTFNLVFDASSTPPGQFINDTHWHWNHMYSYQSCRFVFPASLDCEEIGTVRLTATLRLNGFQARWEQETSPWEGPALYMTHRYECREDDFIDASCSETGDEIVRSSNGATRATFRSEGQSYERKTDKFFWNFSYAWSAAGATGQWQTPRFTSERYVCNGEWEEGDPGWPCFFLTPSYEATLSPSVT